MAIRHQRSYAARQLPQARSVCLNLKLGIFRAGADQPGADQSKLLVFHLRRPEDGKCLKHSITQSVLPKPYIALLHASKEWRKELAGVSHRAGTSGYERSMLRAMKNTFAGRSPNRRIK